MSNRNFAFTMTGIVLGFLVLIYAVNHKMFPWQKEDIQTAAKTSKQEDEDDEKKKARNVMVAKQPDKPPKPGMVKIGGIWRPKSDVEHLLGAKKATNSKQHEKPKLNIGATPFLKADRNEYVKSVAQAIREKKNPERLSVFKRGKPFDLAKFKESPETYLNTIEPGRVFQPAKPAENVKAIKRKGTGFVKLIQGETATLQVKAEPNAPVSFHSSKLGQFSSGLTSITVQANEAGIAEAQFTATGGTYQDVEILAASPMNTGQVDFLIYVELPTQLPKIEK